MRESCRVLKRCPFCGSYARVQMDYRFKKCEHDFPKWYIECQGCKIRTPIAKINTVVQYWNRRAKSDIELMMEDDGK